MICIIFLAISYTCNTIGFIYMQYLFNLVSYFSLFLLSHQLCMLWASTNPRYSLEALIRNQTLVVYQRLQRLTWICLHMFAERLFKSSSISYLPCRRVACDRFYVGMPYAWSIDRTSCRMFNRQNSQNIAILALNSIERPVH